MKTENWNGNQIRFVEHNGEWWAVLKDVCDALGLNAHFVKARLDNGAVSNTVLKDRNGRPHETLIVNEFGIYDTVFQSRKKEAKEFRIWVYAMLKTLREAAGLEGFEVFLTMDKQYQNDMMQQLSRGIRAVRPPVRVDFIKANTIANKAVSNMHGLEKMIKKPDMTPKMLVERESVLKDTVNLMELNERYGMGISVSDMIYRGYQKDTTS